MSLEESLEGVIFCPINLTKEDMVSALGTNIVSVLVLCFFDSNTLLRNKLVAVALQSLFSSGSFSHPWFSHFRKNTIQYVFKTPFNNLYHCGFRAL